MTAPPTRQRLEAAALPRHRHAEGYLAVVLAGGYLEAGDGGRIHAQAGDAIVHRPFEAHLNRVLRAGAQVLNLPLADAGLPTFGRVVDPDDLARLAARDPRQAAERAAASFGARTDSAGDWPDELARTLSAGPLRLRDWAAHRGITPEHLARGFRAAYGVSPKRYAFEARARMAWRAITAGSAPLADVALAAGFFDQAHMSRAVLALTGRTPGAWRASTAYKTAAV